MFDSKRIRLTKPIIIAILLAALILSGCAGKRGWPGAQSEGDTLYVATMDGRVIAMNPDSRIREWDWQPTAKVTGGFLSCGGAAGSGLAGGKFYGSPVISNGMVYITSFSGKVYTIDSGSGVELYDTGSPIVGSVAVGNNTVFVGCSDGNLYALDANTGEPRQGFPFRAGDQIWSTPTVKDGVVYFGSLDHSLYALNATDGTKKWAFETGGGIASTPLIVGGVVYIGSFDKKFYAIDADTGTQKWIFEGAGNWFWSEALYNNGTIYAGSLDHNVYAIDAGNGTPAWPKPFKASDQVKSSPVIAGGVLVVASEDGMVYGLDLKTGEKKWQFDGIKAKVLAPLCAVGGKVYINTQSNSLYALDAETGRQDWNISLGK